MYLPRQTPGPLKVSLTVPLIGADLVGARAVARLAFTALALEEA